MIPVTSKNYIEFDLNKKTTNKNEMFRIELMNNQLRWLTSNKDKIYKNSRLLYKLYKENKLSDSIKKRCCNFPLLERICLDYNQL